MSKAYQQPIDETDGVADPSDYKQKHRLKSILTARDHVKEQRDKALDLQVTGIINENLSKKMVRIAVEGYVLELENKIKTLLPDPNTSKDEFSTEQELAHHVWHEVPLGGINLHSGGQHEFTGLSEYINAPDLITESWVETQNHPIDGNVTVEQSMSHELPIDVSMRAYRVLNYFSERVKLDVEFKEKLPHEMI